MPSTENIQLYLTGAWRMMMGKPDGLRLLDLSADGFWNSFFAIVVALPALVVGWVRTANELSQFSDVYGSKLSVVVRLAAIDLGTWVLPLIALAAVASRAGIGDRFVHFVVASNWASALIVWIMLPPALLGLFLPAASEVITLLSLVLFVLTMVLSWRVTNIAIGKGPAVGSAVFAGVFLISLVVLFVLQAALGLDASTQVPVE
ncbi:MAG TPA: transporter [Rhizobiaceae bacterium]